jgi:hypothetical protein
MYPDAFLDVSFVNARSHDLDVMPLKNRGDDVLYYPGISLKSKKSAPGKTGAGYCADHGQHVAMLQ